MRWLWKLYTGGALVSSALLYLKYLAVAPRGQGPLAAEQAPPRPGGSRGAAGPRDGAPPAGGTRAGKFELLQIGGPWGGTKRLLQMMLADLPEDLLPRGGDCDVLLLTGWKFPYTVVANMTRPPPALRNPEVVLIVNQEFQTNHWVWGGIRRRYAGHAVILGNWWNSTHMEHRDENVTSLWVPFGSVVFASRLLSTPMDFASRGDASRRSRLQACSSGLLSGQADLPRVAAYLQRNCNTSRAGQRRAWGGYREKFWDELNLRMLEELNTRGTALGECNGEQGIAAHLVAGRSKFPDGSRLAGPCGRTTRFDESVGLFAQFKVAVTLENTVSKVGYITEKIGNSLLAETIPIYAGCRQIPMMFEPGSYFLLEPGENDAEVIASVIETLRNDSLYASMLRRKVISDEAMRRFFSWHPAVWPTHGDSLRRRIIGELLRQCRRGV